MKKEEVEKKKIIVYDFDKTLYDGETGVNFSVFYLKKYPIRSVLFLMKYSKDLIFYLLKIIDLTTLKERYFEFLERHSKGEVEKLVAGFWKTKRHKIYSWTREELEKNKKECEMVIVSSASPLFLIENFLLSLGYDKVFGTNFVNDGKDDKVTFVAKIDGENNKGEEKVKKLDEWAKENGFEYEIVKFYSDSLADEPLYNISCRKYWIKKGIKIEGMPKRKTLFDKLFWK
ncbi:HAD-superfamily hydrolase [Leptotrichia wadei]|uniref:HAD-superfamily hydrolase n=1 Tax=Leptotrichia wadei TaxID=157687 RepID=A0A510K601_9FUSO|nr:HAD-IB family phosphatase [Leptotrichia wadei]BBM47062.1 HAD-superfamily hydrolase [Leptotrichia wadei]